MSDTNDKAPGSGTEPQEPQELKKNPSLNDLFTPDVEKEIAEQAKTVVIPNDSESQRQYAEGKEEYDLQKVSVTILRSVSDNINEMAEAIRRSEDQKSDVRSEYVGFFKWLLVALLVFCGVLIWADTFYGFHVRTEFLISAVVAIIADVFAIVQTLANYMTNVEHYNAFNQMIDSLLKHIDLSSQHNNGPSDTE